MWPRVIRSTADGKVTITFVCDPKNPKYGTIETLFFDDKSGRIQAREWNFQKAAPSPASYTHKNPTSCTACHTGSTANGIPSIKFLWKGYPVWGDCIRDRGTTLYGMHDDRIKQKNTAAGFSGISANGEPDNGCTDDQYAKALNEEAKDYQAFRAAQRENACFKSLPWPKPNESAAANPSYPYQGKDLSIDVQPNLRFTTVYARWTARQIANRLKQEDPKDYEALKYYVAMEGAGCIDSQDEEYLQATLGKKLKAMNPALGPIEFVSPGQGSSIIAPGNPITYNLSKLAGLSDADWTLDFQFKDTYFNAGLGSIASLVAGRVLEDIATENPNIAPLANASLGYLKYGRADNSCFDNAAREIGSDYQDYAPKKDKFCAALREEKDKMLAALSAAPDSCGPNPIRRKSAVSQLASIVPGLNHKLKQTQKPTVVAANPAPINRQPATQPKSPLVLFQKYCSQCHGEDSDNELPLNNASALRNYRTFLFRATVADKLKSGAMPPAKVTNHLPEADRKAMIEFLSGIGK